MTKITTEIAGLVLHPLTEQHAPELFRLVQDNRDHLTAHGDYAELVASAPAALAQELATENGEGLRFGIFHQQELVGRIDLVPVDPPRYGLGYWLGHTMTGKGYATASLRAVLVFAASTLGATDVFAGVTHGNRSSVALLERTGFTPVETFEKYTRFHRALGD